MPCALTMCCSPERGERRRARDRADIRHWSDDLRADRWPWRRLQRQHGRLCRSGAWPLSAASASAIRRGEGSAPPSTDTCVSDFSAVQAIGDERCRHGEIAGAAAEFVETKSGVICQQRQSRFDEQFVFGQRRRHDAGEKIASLRLLRSPRVLLATSVASSVAATRHHSDAGIGMRQAAAERAAHADRIVRDMARDDVQQLSPADCRSPVCETPHAARRRQSTSVFPSLAILSRPGDLVDVHEMRGLREPKRHDRNETLPAGQHAAVLRRYFGQDLQRLIEGLRRMADKRRRLH